MFIIWFHQIALSLSWVWLLLCNVPCTRTQMLEHYALYQCCNTIMHTRAQQLADYFQWIFLVLCAHLQQFLPCWLNPKCRTCCFSAVCSFPVRFPNAYSAVSRPRLLHVSLKVYKGTEEGTFLKKKIMTGSTSCSLTPRPLYVSLIAGLATWHAGHVPWGPASDDLRAPTIRYDTSFKKYIY